MYIHSGRGPAAGIKRTLSDMKCEGVKNAHNRLRVSARLYEDNDINNNNTTR